jgi:DNA ligase 1
MTLLDAIVATSRRVSEERGRLAKTRLLADCLARMAPEEIPIGVAYLSGELPQGRIGVGWAAVRDAAPDATAPAPELTLGEVDRVFSAVAAESGGGSGGRRLSRLREVFSRATACEQEFLRRRLTGELRQGALEGVMAEAIARAAALPPSDVRRALMLSGGAGAVAHAALTGGASALSGYRLELFRPLQPMLAQTAESPGAALDRLERAALEYKLDGARIQRHKQGQSVRVFSRELNDVTLRVPEIVRAARAPPEAQARILAARAMWPATSTPWGQARLAAVKSTPASRRASGGSRCHTRRAFSGSR